MNIDDELFHKTYSNNIELLEVYNLPELARFFWDSAKKWIPVSERLPEKSGVPVIAYGKNKLGKGRTIRAAYVQRWTIEYIDNYEGDGDYCKEKDTTYCPEGWYEWNECEDTHWMVEFDITYWQPLPPPPEEE